MLTTEEYEKKKNEAKNAALAGDVEAQWKYSKFLMGSNSTIEEYRQGLVFLILAASQGHCLAQIDLAYKEFYGKGGNKDIDDALLLCERSISTFQEAIQKQNTDDKSQLSFLIRNQNKAIRLRDTILKLRSIKDPVSDAQLALCQAFEHRNMSILEPMLDEQVTFTVMFRPPYIGKTEVLNCFERLLKKDFEISFIPTERYGMVLELYFPNDMHNIIRSLLLTRTNENEKIQRIAHQAYNGGDYCFTIGSKPFAWEEIEPCLSDIDTARNPQSSIIRGRMFCMNCGKLSDDLKWIHFHSNPKLHNGFSYIGRMSVCPDCHQQVEFICEDCKIEL